MSVHDNHASPACALTNDYTDYPDITRFDRRDMPQVVVIPKDYTAEFSQFCDLVHEDLQTYTTLVQDDRAPMARAEAFAATALYEDYGIAAVDPTVVVWYYDQHDTAAIYAALCRSKWFARAIALNRADDDSEASVTGLEAFMRKLLVDPQPIFKESRARLREERGAMTSRERFERFADGFSVDADAWGKTPDDIQT